MLPVIPCLVGKPIKLTSGRFTTGTGLFASIFYFMNRNTVRWSDWSATSFTIYDCADKDTSVDAFSTSLYLHGYVALLQCYRISHSHVILSGRAILQIITKTIWLATCVPCEVH